ncbi:MAG: hypothetical protein U9Q80_00070 [Bacillota bacterium]|nr:hypothetical protein [Bacillota bacterium]
MIGIVKKINLSVTRGRPRVKIDQGEFIKNEGLKGDSYFGSKVEVVMLPYANRIEVDNSKENGLCFERFLETLSIDFNDFTPKIGDVLTIGTAEFKVASLGKRCFPECEIVQKRKTCALSRGTVYLDVIKSGVVSIGNRVILKSRGLDDRS